MSMIKQTLGMFIIVVISLAFIGYGHVMGWFVQNVSYQSFYAENLKRISEYLPLRFDKKNPIPAVIMAHGCGGIFNHQERWAKNFNEIGVAGFVVDSYSNRELSPRPVCKGHKFYAHQRAADLIAALDYVLTLPYIDQNQLYLAGWSHGGWTVLDTVTLLNHNQPPSNLDALSGRVDDLKLAGTIIFYPYCGKLSKTDQMGWTGAQRSLVMLVENDHLIDEKECMNLFDKMSANGHQIDVEIFSDVEHAFDYPAGLESYGIISDHVAYLRAKERVIDFLSQAIRDL